MTAEPDALRLVPEHVVDEAISLAPVLRSRGRKNSVHDIKRAANLLELLALGASMPAAPAVQPAAGEAEYARAVMDTVPTIKGGWDTAYKIAKRVAALAHPPQGSESGGEATGAQAVIRDGQIVISIDIDALPLILSGSIATNSVAGTFKVTDPATFAKEVCYSLNDEKEDGTTRVHMMFDSAFNHAIDQGAEGVEEITEDEFDMEAARLAGAALSPQPGPASEGEAPNTVPNTSLHR